MNDPGPSGALLLDAEKGLATLQSLNARIGERFPHSSLFHAGQSFEAICARSKKRIDWISRPIWPLHLARYLLIGAILAGLVLMVIGLRTNLRPSAYSIIDVIQTLGACRT